MSNMKHISILLAILMSVNAYAQPASGKPDTRAAMFPEDSAHVSGDWGNLCLAVRNDNAGTTFGGSNGDYSPISVSSSGTIYTTVIGANNALSIGRSEDSASADGDMGVPAFAVREDALTVNTSTTGDYTYIKADGAGRQITTFAPPGETWQACGTATAVTSDVAIKAAVASNRIYVTGITCKNTAAATSTTIDFKDGTTIISVGSVANTGSASPGGWAMTYTVPLRGTSATAFNFATNVATSSVTCCANGYISVH